MIHEKIIKRDGGGRVKIVVRLVCEYNRDFKWEFMVYTCEPGKRTWKPALDDNSWSWRKLDYAAREVEKRRLCLAVTTEMEVADAMRELVAKIVPII